MKTLILLMLANFVLTNAMVTNAQCPHSGLNYLSIEMNGINNSPLNQAGTWHQIFGDEFLAPPLAPTWSIGRGNLRNQVCAAGNTANVYVNGGYLNITATDEDTAGYNFSTGEVYSMAYSGSTLGGKTEFIKDCYIEIKAQVPSGSNIWPSLWLWGCHGAYEEIEINEFFNCGLDYATNVYGETGTSCSVNLADQYWINPRSNNISIDLSAADHIYGLQWTNKSIKFYLDNQLLRIFTGSFIPQNPLNLMLSCQIGAHCNYYDVNDDCANFNSTLCDPIPTDLPKNLKIDYVRVYTKNNSALYFNAAPSEICVTNSSCSIGGVALRAAFYPEAVYTFNSPDGAFTISDEGWGVSQRCIRYASGSVNSSHPIEVTITFPQFSNYSETKTVWIYITGGLPAKPTNVSWVLSGCQYYARCSPVPDTDYYLWSDESSFGNTIQTSSNSCPSCLALNCETTTWYVKSHNICGYSSNYAQGTKIVNIQSCPCRLFEPSNEATGFLLFPNPASGSFTISTNEDGLLLIINKFGQIIQSFSINAGKLEIFSEKYPSGLYLLNFQTCNGVQSKKILIEH